MQAARAWNDGDYVVFKKEKDMVVPRRGRIRKRLELGKEKA
jgi:hypothetical protein